MNKQQTPYQSKIEIPKRALSETEAAAYIGLSRSFLRKSRMDGQRANRIPPPPYIRLGNRTIRYLIEDLDLWLDRFKSGLTAKREFRK